MSRDVETLRDPRPVKRYLDADDEGMEGEVPAKENSPEDIAEDGYRLISRRPRARGFDRIVPAEQADRIEGYFRPMIDRSYDTDY